MGQCQICGDRSPLISSRLGVCLSCIREKPEEAIKITDRVHAESRERFGLPPKPPRDPNGIPCGVCSNDCKISVGGKGFCGLVFNMDGRLVRMGGTSEKGILQWYYDLPTTSRDLAHQCYNGAKKYLENVRIGNMHLLGCYN